MKYQAQYLISSEALIDPSIEFVLPRVIEKLLYDTLRETNFLFEDIKLWWRFEVITRARHEVKVQRLKEFKLLYEQPEYSPLYGGTLIQGYKGVPTIGALKSLPYNSEVNLTLTIVKDE
jgi:hypothetical protein